MIEKPDMDKAVFCRVIRTPDNGDITFPKFSPFPMKVDKIVEKKSPWKKGISS
jgi:hypothetical protein